MSLIGTLVSFTPGAKAVSADVNANFSSIRSAFNTSAVLNDTATTITVAHTISASPGLIFSAGTSRIVPGVTSFAIRNNANTADNLLVSDAGLVTARAGFVSTLGGVSLIANSPTSGLVIGRSAPLGDRMLEIAGIMAQAPTEYGAFFQPTFDVYAVTAGEVLGIQLNTQSGSFTQTTSRGIHIYNPVKGSGSSITTLYGLQIESQTAGGTNFAISTASGRVSFGDNVTCAAALNVAGAIVVTGNATIAGLATLGGTNAAGSFVIVNTMTTALSNELAIATTFNSPGNDLTALRIAITDTSSAVGAKAFSVGVGANTVFKIPKEGGAVTQAAALATSATAGFVYIPTCPGTATGVPATQTGCVALWYDTTNNRLQVYNGGLKTVALT